MIGGLIRIVKNLSVRAQILATMGVVVCAALIIGFQSFLTVGAFSTAVATSNGVQEASHRLESYANILAEINRLTTLVALVNDQQDRVALRQLTEDAIPRRRAAETALRGLGLNAEAEKLLQDSRDLENQITEMMLRVQSWREAAEVLFLGVEQAGTTYRRLSEVLADEPYRATEMAEGLQAALADTVIPALRFALTTRQEDLERAVAAVDRLVMLTDEAQVRIGTIRSPAQAALRFAQRDQRLIFTYLRQLEQTNTQLTLYLRQFRAGIDYTLQQIVGLRDRVAGQASESTRRLLDSAEQATNRIGILAGLLVLFGLPVAWVLGNGVANPVRLLAGIVGRLSAGDRQAVIPLQDRRNEIGEIARAMEAFRQAQIAVMEAREHEIERERALQEERNLLLLRHQVELEDTVNRRTRELQDAIEQLRETQDEMVQQEKLAALGGMVAGIAHEVNTPLGVATTATSTCAEQVKILAAMVNSGQLRKSELTNTLEQLKTGLDLLDRNLARAAQLIRQFKGVAVDRAGEHRRTFDLAEVVTDTLTILHPVLKKGNYKIDSTVQSIMMDSYPGPLSQILTNLVQNALVHAFEGRDHGMITVRARLEGGTAVLSIADDGHGMPPETRDRAFDAFFTTKRGRGGSGLGLHIVRALVQQVLGGRIDLESEQGRGTTFTLRLPISAPVVPADQQAHAA